MSCKTYFVPDEKRLISRFWQSASGFWRGPSAWRAWFLIVLLTGTVLLQLLTQYGLNFWNRDFFNAIERRDATELWAQALRFVPFAAASPISPGALADRKKILNQIRKESGFNAMGFNNPSTSLMIVDLPPPEPPRMILVSPFITLKLSLFRITRSSKASTTSRNSIAGMMRWLSSTSAKVEPAAFRLTSPEAG